VRASHLILVLRSALLLAVTASAALAVEYANAGDPAFCGVGSACFQARISPQSRAVAELLNVSLPVLGLVAHLVLFVASVVAPTALYHVVIAVLQGMGAAFAAYLLYAQATEIGAFCPWCVTVDVSAVVAAVAAALVARAVVRGTLPEAEWRALSGRTRAAGAWAIAGAVALGAPFVWGSFPVVPPMPADIAAQQVQGKTTLVMFTDFECPYCRKLHPVIEELERESKGALVVVRRMKPLSGHPGALPAALAYLCTSEDRREAMATALYDAPPSELTPSGVVAIAKGVGLDLDAFARCVVSPETKARLDEDAAMYDRIGPRGLPLTYVGPRAIVGFDEAKVRRSVATELSGGRIGLPVWTMFVVVVAAIGAAVVVGKSALGAVPAPATRPDTSG
jgi:uncharacterized membrane protein